MLKYLETGSSLINLLDWDLSVQDSYDHLHLNLILILIDPPPLFLPNSRSNQNKNQTKNLERLYNCLVSLFLSFFLVCHGENSSDVTLAFEDAD